MLICIHSHTIHCEEELSTLDVQMTILKHMIIGMHNVTHVIHIYTSEIVPWGRMKSSACVIIQDSRWLCSTTTRHRNHVCSVSGDFGRSRDAQHMIIWLKCSYVLIVVTIKIQIRIFIFFKKNCYASWKSIWKVAVSRGFYEIHEIHKNVPHHHF